MPRTTSKKQTRLSFAPTAASGDAIEDENDRFARLAYSHPNLATVRPERSRRTKHASPPVVASSSTTTTTSRQIASPVKESKKGKKERKEKKKDKKGKMEKKEKKDKDKRKLKDPEEEGRQTYTDPSHASMDYGPTPAKAQPVQPEPEVSSKDEIVMPGSTKQARRASVDFAIMKPVQSSQSPQLPFGSPNVIINLDSSEEDERDIVQPRRRLKRKAERSSVILSDSDDSEPVVSSPVKRRRWASPMETPRTPHSSVDKDQQEIDDDVRDLQDSGIVNVYTYRAYAALFTNILQLSSALARAVGHMSLQGTRNRDFSRPFVVDVPDRKKKARSRTRSRKMNFRNPVRPTISSNLDASTTTTTARLNPRSMPTKTLIATKTTSSWRTTNSAFRRRRSHSSSPDTLTSNQRSTSAMSWHGWCTTV